jgi:uncharacterized protein (UPF0261 family)
MECQPIIAILATINTKSKETYFIANVLKRAGATPWTVDLSMRPGRWVRHGIPCRCTANRHRDDRFSSNVLFFKRIIWLRAVPDRLH